MIELTLSCADHHTCESISDVLFEKGAVSVTLLDAEDTPLLEPKPGETPLWDKIIIKGLFTEYEPACLTQLFVEQCFEGILSSSLNLLESKDWLAEVNALQKPLCFEQNFWIYPSSATPPAQDTPYLILDSGLAFGTGTHPTTALCINWLVNHQKVYTEQAILDYGCGSGILGLSALKLGASCVYGVDIDPQALEASERNLKKNTLAADRAHWVLPESLAIPNDKPIHLLIANILLGPLCELNTAFQKWVMPKGYAVLSGILGSQVEALKAHFKAPIWDHIETFAFEEWALVVFQRSEIKAD